MRNPAATAPSHQNAIIASGETRGIIMLVIAILLLLSAVTTAVAVLAASPLFRMVTLAIDSWADDVQGQARTS